MPIIEYRTHSHIVGRGDVKKTLTRVYDIDEKSINLARQWPDQIEEIDLSGVRELKRLQILNVSRNQIIV